MFCEAVYVLILVLGGGGGSAERGAGGKKNHENGHHPSIDHGLSCLPLVDVLAAACASRVTGRHDYLIILQGTIFRICTQGDHIHFLFKYLLD